MSFYNKIENYVPFLLPLLILFSRTTADIIVTSIALLFLIKSVQDNNFNWLSYKWVQVTIIFFLYLIIVNTPLSYNPAESFYYSFGFLRWPIFSLAIAIWIFRTDIAYKKFLLSTLFFGFIFIADIWYQFLINENGIFGLSSNNFAGRLSIPFSNNVFPGRIITYLTFFIIIISFYLNLSSNKKQNPYFIFSILFIGFFSTLITGERMSFLIFLSSILILQIPLIFIHKYKIILFNIILFLLVLLVFFLAPSLAERSFFSVIEKLQNFWESDYGVVFLSSIERWLQNPFFGFGMHQFQLTGDSYRSGIIEITNIRHAHNLPLNLLVETGVVGFFLFYLIIFFIIKELFLKIKNNLPFLLLLLIFIYLSFFPFHSHFSFSHNWINTFSWLSIGLIFSISNLYEKNNKNK